jgi:WD40 repeat protein
LPTLTPNAVVVIAEQETEDEAKANAAAQLAQQQTKESLEQVTAEKQNTEKALTKSEWLVYAGNIGRTQEAWNDGRVADAWTFLNACRQDFRGWEHDYLYTLFNKNQKTFRGHTRGVRSVAWSPDGERIVSGSMDNTLKVWDAALGQETRTGKGKAD